MQSLVLHSMNPLIPTPVEMTVLGLGFLVVVIFFVAFVDIARSRYLTSRAQAGWVLLALIFPLGGPILWFALGRRSAGTNNAMTASRGTTK